MFQLSDNKIKNRWLDPKYTSGSLHDGNFFYFGLKVKVFK